MGRPVFAARGSTESDAVVVVHVNRPDLLDTSSLVPRLSRYPLIELTAGRDEPAHALLTQCALSSAQLWATYDGESRLQMLGGVCPTPFTRLAIPWMLGSDWVYQHHSRAFLRETRKIVQQMRRYGRLVNYTHAHYTDSHRWLEWCGFTVSPHIDHIRGGEPFVRFHYV